MMHTHTHMHTFIQNHTRTSTTPASASSSGRLRSQQAAVSTRDMTKAPEAMLPCKKMIVEAIQFFIDR